MAYKWSLINNSILRSIIDFLLIIKNLISQNQAYKDYKVTFNRSDFFFLTKSYKRLYKVFLKLELFLGLRYNHILAYIRTLIVHIVDITLAQLIYKAYTGQIVTQVIVRISLKICNWPILALVLSQILIALII